MIVDEDHGPALVAFTQSVDLHNTDCACFYGSRRFIPSIKLPVPDFSRLDQCYVQGWLFGSPFRVVRVHFKSITASSIRPLAKTVLLQFISARGEIFQSLAKHRCTISSNGSKRLSSVGINLHRDYVRVADESHVTKLIAVT